MKTILLVEDEALIAMAEAQFLKRRGYNVVVADSAEKAVTAANAGDIDIILMDIDLGADKTDGTRAAEIILEDHDIPVVFLSSHTEPEVVEKTEKITSYGYIVKNSGETVLLASIKMAFKLFDAHEELARQKEHLRTTLVRQESMETELEKSETRFRQLFNNMSSCVIVYEAVDSGENFRIVNINKAAEKAEQTNREQITGKLVTDVFPGIVEFGLLDVFKRVFKTGDAEHKPVSRYHDEKITGWRENYVYKLPSEEIVAVYEDVTAKKRAEEDLRDSDARWQFAVEGVKDGLWDWDANTNRVFFSRQWKAMLGYEEDEIGDSFEEWQERIHPEDLDRCLREVDKLLKDETPFYTLEHRLRCKNGRYKWILARGRIITRNPDGSPQRLIGTHTDIDEEVRIKCELHQKESEVSSLIENSPDIIIRYDTSLRHTFCNKAVERYFSLPRASFIGKTPTEVSGPGPLTEEMEEYLQKALESRSVVKAEQCFELSMGSVHFSMIITPEKNAEGQLLSLLVVARDISERKKYERLNEERRRYLEAVLETAPLAVVAMDTKNRVMEWNHGAEALFHFTKEEVLGRNLDDLVCGTSEETRAEADSLTGRLSSGEELLSLKLIRYTREGKPIHVLVSGTPIYIEDTWAGNIGSYMDISTLVEQEEEVEQLLRDKETLLKEVHHRIKNHMTAIMTILDLKTVGADDTTVLLLKEIEQRISLMQDIYNTLYLGGDISSLLLTDFLENLLDKIEAAYLDGKKVRIERDIAETRVSAMQSLPIGVIITELVTNAVKYAFKDINDGLIHVSAHPAYSSEDSRLRLKVSTNGIRMPEEIVLDRKFGFGLTIVDSYARQFDGRMDFSDDARTVTVNLALKA